MQKIAFTLCSNNYLAHAKTLGDSLLRLNPEFHFVIGLVDGIDPLVDYLEYRAFEILPYDSLGCAFFKEMIGKYNIIEFNTAVKPFYFEYFFEKYGEHTIVYYLDPDIVIYSDFNETNRLLDTHTFLITPHFLTPSVDLSPFETKILRVGIYNLGFIAIRNTSHAKTFLLWWQERLKNYCYIDYSRGLFVDQVWINFMTVLFQGVCVLQSPGYNMACWNFHERKLIESSERYYVNDLETPLVFFHFSGFKPSDMHFISKMKISELTLQERPDVRKIFYAYAASLKSNNYEMLSKVKPVLTFSSKKYTRKQRIGRSLKSRMSSYIKRVFNV